MMNGSIKKILTTVFACVTAAGTLTLMGCEVPNIVIGGKPSVGGNGGGEYPAAEFVTPTKAYSEWQDYTIEQYVTEDVTGKSIAYQFAADDARIGSDSNGRNYDILINLYSDGMAQIRQYYEPDLYVVTYYGYWANMDNEYLYMGVVCHTNSMYANTVHNISYSYNLTKTGDMFDTFGLNVAFGFGEGGMFVRNFNMSGDGKVVYSSNEEYEKHLNLDIKEPDYTPSTDEDNETKLLFSFTSDSENYLFDCYDDCTYVFTFKTAGLIEKGTWSWSGWKFTYTNENGETTEAVRDENKALTFKYKSVVKNGAVTRDFSCASSVWGVAFGGKGDYEAPRKTELLFSFASDSENYLFDCYDDCTYVFTFKTAGLVEKGTWSWSGWKFTYTNENGETTEAVRDENKALTFKYKSVVKNGAVTRDFSCASSVWGVAFDGKGDYELK